jgi:hypothetical protein
MHANAIAMMLNYALMMLMMIVAEPTWITPAQVRESSLEGYLVLQTV